MTDQRDDLYVGYLPMPPRYVRFLRILIPALLIALVAINAIAVWQMRSPGPAVWDTSSVIALTGTVRAHPYPALIVDGETILVVEVGKIGAQRRLTPLDGQRITLIGYQLHRGPHRMLELDPAPEAIAPADGPPTPTEPTARGNAVRLVGEIMDAKCWLGAMKPGRGKGHKACATLCIEGGIPPLFVAAVPDGQRVYLLTDDAGGPAVDLVRPFVGEPVRIQGTIVPAGGSIPYLALPPGSIERR